MNSVAMETTVRVFYAERYDGAGWPPEDFHGFVAWFTEHFESIPSQYRDSARVELDSRAHYEDSHYASIEITYKRPETEDEEAQRLAAEKQRLGYAEAAERRTLAALKAKYGD